MNSSSIGAEISTEQTPTCCLLAHLQARNKALLSRQARIDWVWPIHTSTVLIVSFASLLTGVVSLICGLHIYHLRNRGEAFRYEIIEKSIHGAMEYDVSWHIFLLGVHRLKPILTLKSECSARTCLSYMQFTMDRCQFTFHMRIIRCAKCICLSAQQNQKFQPHKVKLGSHFSYKMSQWQLRE